MKTFLKERTFFIVIHLFYSSHDSENLIRISADSSVVDSDASDDTLIQEEKIQLLMLRN